MNLFELFNSLKQPTVQEENYFSAVVVGDYKLYHLGKDLQSRPLLLISAKNFDNRIWSAPIALENLSIVYNVECTVTGYNGVIDRSHFTILRCTNSDQGLHYIFLRIIDSIILLLGESPTADDIFRAINRLVDLFRSIAKPPQKPIQGLWAELFLIARARNPILLAKTWHISPTAHYDFSDGEKHVEVKSSSNRIRQHYFSLEQLNPFAGGEVIVASMFIEASQGGKSINDLIQRIRNRLKTPALILQFEQIVATTLGNNWPYAVDARFDDKLAEQSLKFYATINIPSVNSIVPKEVSHVRFLSDITNVNPLNIKEYQGRDDIFGCLSK